MTISKTTLHWYRSVRTSSTLRLSFSRSATWLSIRAGMVLEYPTWSYCLSFLCFDNRWQHTILRPTMTTIKLFRVFALSQEFKLLPVRQDVSNHFITSLRPFIAPPRKIGAGKTTRACTLSKNLRQRSTSFKDSSRS